MKLHIYQIALMGILPLTAACSRIAPEVVESDYSYAPDANVVKVEKPTPFDFNESNLVASSLGDEAAIILRSTSPDEMTIRVPLKLRRALTQPVVVEFGVDSDVADQLINTYVGSQLISLNNIDGLKVEIPTGVTEYEAQIKLKGLKALFDSENEYVSALSMMPNDLISVSESSKPVMIHLYRSALEESENVAEWTYTTSDFYEVPQGTQKLTSVHFTPSSNYRNDIVKRVADDNYYGGVWWVPDQTVEQGRYIQLNFDKTYKVAAIRFVTIYDGNEYKTIESGDVYVSDDGGKNFVSWGNYVNSEPSNMGATLQILEPKPINAIRIDNLYSNHRWANPADAYININEIEIFVARE